jgi:serine/threonine protein phosphatase PrpC
MAPEMFDIDAKYTGPAVDVWSLGATLYMMIIGHPPWLADNEIELSGKVQRDELCFPGDIERSMDPHLRNLIQRMLTKDPSLRITLNDCFTHDWITKEGSEPLCLTAQENDLTVSMDESEYAIQNIPERIDSSLNESLEKAHILIKTRLQQQREGNTNSSSGILLTTNERALLSKKISTSNPPTKILTSFRNCTGENPTGSGASTPSSSGTTGSSPNRPSSEEAGRIVFAWRRHKRVQLMSGHKNLSERAKELLLEQKRIAFSADRAKVTEIILPAPPRSRLSNSSAQLQSQISSVSTERHRHSAPAIQMPATATGFSRKSTSNDLNLVSSSGINTPADTCAGGLTRCDNSNNLASIDSTNSTLATALGSSASLCPKVICVSSNESGSGSSSPTPMAVKDSDLMKRPLQRKKDFLMVTSEVFRDEGGDYQSRKILFQAREDDFSVASRVPAHSNSIRDLSRRKSSSLLAHKASRKTSSLMNASASSINSSNSNSNPRWSLAETSEIDMEGIECIEVADDDSEIRSDTSDNQGIGDNDIDEDESDEDYSDVEGDVDVDSTFNELIGTPSHLQIVEEDLDVAPINLTSAAAASTSFDLRPIVQVYVSSKIRENLVLGIRSGYAEAKGSRSYMEDRSLGITEYTSTPRTLFESRTGLASTAHAMIAKTYESVGYFAVYDGHNGDETATYLQKELHMRIFSHDKFIDDPKVAIEECCQSIDEEILLNQNNSLPMKLESEENHPCLKLTPISFSGSTGVLALVLKKKALPKDASIIVSEDAPMNDTYLYIANIGDCRAVFCQNGIAVDITIDHKASHPAEKKRIEESGGFVHNGRLDGILAISRGFGDSAHKQEGHLIVKPDVYTRRVDPEDEFVLLASDGLYDVLSSQQAINFIRKKLRSHGDVQLAAQELVLKAQEYFSHDNISVIIICLNQK